MKFYVHEFYVSSGKHHKLITKVYSNQIEAYQKWKLLGGSLITAEVIKREGRLCN